MISAYWLGPTWRVLREYVSRREGDDFDGIYGSIEASLLKHIELYNTVGGAKKFNFSYRKVSRAMFPQDIKVPEGHVPTRLGTMWDDQVPFNIQKCHLIIAYLDPDDDAQRKSE